MEEKQPSYPLTDLDAHQLAMSLPISDVVNELVAILGATTVAVIGGVSETRAVHQWTLGREPQRHHVLRFTLQIARMVAAVDGTHESVRAWFQGSNPRLQDGIPALMLRDERLEAIQGPLMQAARAFASR
jgi:hypothetical protein